MTDVECVEAIAQFLTEKTRDYLLPVIEKTTGNTGKARPPHIFTMRVPRDIDPVLSEVNREDIFNKAPYILVQLVTGDDGIDEQGRAYAHRTLRFVFAIGELDEVKGAKQLLDLIGRIRAEVEKAGVVGAFEYVRGTLSYLIYTADNYPYYFGEMSSDWSIPTIEREVPDFIW